MHDITRRIAQYWANHPSEAAHKKGLFIKGLRESGTVLHAAELAGVDRRQVYRWRDEDPDFRQAWEDTLEDVTDVVERSLFTQAASGKNIVASIFFLKANRVKYRDNLTIDMRAVNAEIEERLAALGQPAARTITAAMTGEAIDEASVSTDETYQLGPANEQT